MHTGTVRYHQPSPTRQAYRIDPDGAVGRLVSPEHDVVEVVLNDQRATSDTVQFDIDGLEFATEPTRVRPSQTDDVWQAAYDAELTALLKKRLGAAEVVVFDHTIRIDDPDAPRRPARNVHTDYSPDGARRRLVDLVGADAAERWEAGHYGFVNVWRPLSIVRTTPLGFVRPRSVKPEDWVLLDLVYPDRRGQIMGLVHDPAHEWLLLSAMRPDEVAIFNIFDNQALPPVAHSAIDLPGTVPGAIRKSVESRTLVRYAPRTED